MRRWRDWLECVTIAFDGGLWAGFLQAAEARALIAFIPLPIITGSLNPPGRTQIELPEATGSKWALAFRQRMPAG